MGDGTGDVRALDVWVENTPFKGRLEARVNRIHRNCQRYMNDTFFFNFLLCALLKKQKKCAYISKSIILDQGGGSANKNTF